MSVRPDCAEARSHFPDMLGGIAESAARSHVAACDRCAEELAGLAAVLEDTARLSGGDVPDPGPDYWDGFLPAVRARIAARGSASLRSRRLWGTAAAAALLAAAGLASLLGSGGGSEADMEARFSGALEALSALPPDEAQLIAGLDPDPFAMEPAGGDDPGMKAILEAMEDLLPPAGGIPWNDEQIQWLLEELDESDQALRPDPHDPEGRP